MSVPCQNTVAVYSLCFLASLQVPSHLMQNAEGTEKEGRIEIEKELYMLTGTDWEHGESSDQQGKERKDGQKENME